MANNRAPIGSLLTIDAAHLQGLLDALQTAGYRTIGPTVRDGAIVYAEVSSIEQLPAGYVDRQDGGSYRLERSENAGYFDHVVGPHSLKGYLFPSRETLLESIRATGRWQMTAPEIDPTPLAVVGVRSCDLHALAIQDKVFLGGPYVDPGYKARREKLFLIAVNCRRAAATCFCHSMKTGPAVKGAFDLALTEMGSQFVVEVGSAKGGEIVARVEWAPATLQQVEASRAVSAGLEAELKARDAKPKSEANGAPRERYLDTTGIHDLLLDNLEHPRWAEVAERCLACANCTMVCPTCFCAAVEEVSDLAGDHIRRERSWDSCFNAEHSYMNTGTVRKSTASRYRQWLTHKLATWSDQFGTSGCVGCGRCITWCPVGIDLTEEVAAIRGEKR
jgi:formate hydrogenlyase subunit 6/NADH:ubiquinone oxidoreductase subunit I